MYFVALLLMLRTQQEERSHAPAELSALCEAMKDFLTQTSQPGSHDFIRIALLAHTRQRITLRITFGERSLESATPRVLRVLLSRPSISLNQHTYLVESLDLTSSPWTGKVDPYVNTIGEVV